MSLDEAERAVLAEIADVLIPAGDGFPSASAAGIAEKRLDEVLSIRPDLAVALKQVLIAAQSRDPVEVVAELQTKDPASFGVLAEVVAGAYFLNPEIRTAIGYDGQTPRPIDPQSSDLDGELLRTVIERGPIYRPTPDRTTE